MQPFGSKATCLVNVKELRKHVYSMEEVSLRKRIRGGVASQGLNQVNNGVASAGTLDTIRERVTLM
ncbi:hypothetical protein CT0861_06245 [Colletotrichum tofieldiae]|uniref:Uncharacterized protein n=1 Tax=Colletotrichum tofieldiae TaxID=708197 RepID=A0A166N797_9PEZI|nr:hypothetical protein CT0861_06245 [Colletotrichum tofieldiae]